MVEGRRLVVGCCCGRGGGARVCRLVVGVAVGVVRGRWCRLVRRERLERCFDVGLGFVVAGGSMSLRLRRGQVLGRVGRGRMLISRLRRRLGSFDVGSGLLVPGSLLVGTRAGSGCCDGFLVG